MIREYQVIVTEIRERTVTVQASSEIGAFNKAVDMYTNQEIVFDQDSIVDASYQVVEA